METTTITPSAHTKVLHGLCPICRHYGDDCTGESTSDHTPGPWIVQNHNEICAESEHESFVAEVFDETDEWRANARLIAAAPKMLERLKMSLADAESMVADRYASADDWNWTSIAEDLRAVIGEAEGS